MELTNRGSPGSTDDVLRNDGEMVFGKAMVGRFGGSFQSRGLVLVCSGRPDGGWLLAPEDAGWVFFDLPEVTPLGWKPIPPYSARPVPSGPAWWHAWRR
jgi:hypothetical protein